MINIRGRISYAFRCKNCILLSTLIFSIDLQQRDLVRTPESGLTSGDFSCISPNLSFYTLQHEHVLRQYNMMLFIHASGKLEFFVVNGTSYFCSKC